MITRASAAPGTAVLLALALTGCATVQGTLDDLAGFYGVSTDPLNPYEQVDRDDPFAGSPAEEYGVGFPDLPEASAVGPYTTDQVAHAYERTQEFLDATYLNQDAVFGEDNSEFVELLEGQALDQYLEDLTNPDYELNSRHMTYNLTPNTAEPIGDEVRVDGGMWAQDATDEYGQDYLAVVTEFMIVHPVARPGEKMSTRMVVSHLGEVAFYEVGEDELEAWPLWHRGVAPAYCLEEYTFTPDYGDGRPEGEQPEGRIQDAYDLEDTRDMDECAAVGDT